MTSDSIASDFFFFLTNELERKKIDLFRRWRHQELNNITQKAAYPWLSLNLEGSCVILPVSEREPVPSFPIFTPAM